MWPQIASALIGGIMTNRAAKKAAEQQRQAGDRAYQRSLPRGVSGLFGTFGYDEQGGSTMALSGDLQSQFDALMGRAGQTAGQIQDLNPLELQKSLYEQQYGLLQPQQERETLEQESRLLQQGRLGSTGGAGQMQALQEAQGQQRAGLMAGSYGVAQQTMDSMRQREMMDRQQALGIGALPMQYANISGAMAGLMGGGAQFAGKQESAAAQGLGVLQGNYWANMMEQFGDREYDKADWDWLGLGGGGDSTPATLNRGGFSERGLGSISGY
jgi:hypothetical protein